MAGVVVASIGVVVAAAAVLASSLFSKNSLRLARKTLETSQQHHEQALAESARQAWNYLGGQQCAAYREQMLALHERGLTPEQIKRWFALERGEGGTAYDDFAEGCGSVEELISLLPPRDELRRGQS